jgi:hypothetical protein
MRVGSQRFIQNAHSLQKMVIMASTFNGIELEERKCRSRLQAEDQVTRCRLTFCLTADHNVWLPDLFCPWYILKGLCTGFSLVHLNVRMLRSHASKNH